MLAACFYRCRWTPVISQRYAINKKKEDMYKRDWIRWCFFNLKWKTAWEGPLCTNSLCFSKIVPWNLFCPHTNSIINPISFLPKPNVKLCLSYSWLRAESVGFGQQDVNWGMLGYDWPSCVSAWRLIKRLATPYVWPKTRSCRAETVLEATIITICTSSHRRENRNHLSS